MIVSVGRMMRKGGGGLNKGNIELTSVCCHGAIIVADRSFTEEEINWLKDNLFRK